MNAAEKEARDEGEWPPLPREIENALRRFDDLAHECGELLASDRDDVSGLAQLQANDEGGYDHTYDVAARRANVAKVRLRRMIRKYLRAEALRLADRPRPPVKVGQPVYWLRTLGGGGGSGARENAKEWRMAEVVRVGNGRAKVRTAPEGMADECRETWVNFESLRPRQ